MWGTNERIEYWKVEVNFMENIFFTSFFFLEILLNLFQKIFVKVAVTHFCL